MADDTPDQADQAGQQHPSDGGDAVQTDGGASVQGDQTNIEGDQHVHEAPPQRQKQNRATAERDVK